MAVSGWRQCATRFRVTSIRNQTAAFQPHLNYLQWLFFLLSISSLFWFQNSTEGLCVIDVKRPYFTFYDRLPGFVLYYLEHESISWELTLINSCMGLVLLNSNSVMISKIIWMNLKFLSLAIMFSHFYSTEDSHTNEMKANVHQHLVRKLEACGVRLSDRLPSVGIYWLMMMIII